jgi:hypothetical protein
MGQWPASFIIMGTAVAGVGGWLRRPSRRAWGGWVYGGLAALLLFAVAGQVMMSVAIQNRRRDAELAGDTIQLGFLRDVIGEAERLMGERPSCDLVVLSKGHQLENSKLALMREFTAVDSVVLADGNLALPLPTTCAVYLDTQPGSRASNWLAETAVSLPPSAIRQESGWTFYELADTSLPAAETAVWENGAALVGVERTAVTPGEPLTLTLTWEIVEPSPNVAYHIGTYLLTPENEVIAQADGPGFDSIQWQVDGRFITWFDIPVPADLPDGAYRLGLAFYTWPGLERINLQAGGNTYFAEDIVAP